MILFNLLIRFFPRAFREAFGDQMRRVYVEQRRTARTHGLRASAVLWTRTVVGMTSAAWRERRDGRRPVSVRLAFMETLVTDLRLTVRMLLGRPLFTTIVIGQDAYGLSGNIVSDNYFDVLGVSPAAGRFFEASGRPNKLQDGGLKLMEIKRLRELGHHITIFEEEQFWRLAAKR